MKLYNLKSWPLIPVLIFFPISIWFWGCSSNCDEGSKENDFQNSFTDPDYSAKHIQRLERDGEGWATLAPKLNLKKGMVVGDIGCGTGVYSFLIARAVGETGKVYALEIQDKLLKIMEKRLPDKSKNPYNNVHLVLNRTDDTTLQANLLDLAIMINVHFHSFAKLSKENIKMIASTFRSMKPGGILLIKDGTHVSEPTSQYVIRHYQNAGFKLVSKEINSGHRQITDVGPEYFLIFKKPSLVNEKVE